MKYPREQCVCDVRERDSISTRQANLGTSIRESRQQQQQQQQQHLYNLFRCCFLNEDRKGMRTNYLTAGGEPAEIIILTDRQTAAEWEKKGGVRSGETYFHCAIGNFKFASKLSSLFSRAPSM